MIRPTVRAGLWRWREALIGAVLVAAGVWWALTGLGLIFSVGVAVAAFGALLVIAGVQRGRFRRGAGGAGVVQVDEREVGYFGPLAGGVVAIDALEMIEFDPTSYPAPHWVLTAQGTAPLRIPTNAEGNEALFDVFSSLDGMETEKMLAALSAASPQPVVIWRKDLRRLH